MKVIDFEKTLYKGDIIEDFVNYIGNKKEKYKKFIPIAKPLISLYKMNFLSLDKLSKFANKYIKQIDVSKEKVETTAKDFWKEYKDNVDKEALKKITKEDVVVTLLPNEFLKPLKLKTKNVLGSIYNYETNEIDFICYKEARSKALLEKYNIK